MNLASHDIFIFLFIFQYIIFFSSYYTHLDHNFHTLKYLHHRDFKVLDCYNRQDSYWLLFQHLFTNISSIIYRLHQQVSWKTWSSEVRQKQRALIMIKSSHILQSHSKSVQHSNLFHSIVSHTDENTSYNYFSFKLTVLELVSIMISKLIDSFVVNDSMMREQLVKLSISST